MRSLPHAESSLSQPIQNVKDFLTIASTRENAFNIGFGESRMIAVNERGDDAGGPTSI